METKKTYLVDGDKTFIGSTQFTRNTNNAGGWQWDGSDDDMYFNGKRVQWDDNGLPYVEEDNEEEDKS